MSTVCPQCASPVEQDFGVATCGQCAAVLFIDLDGNASLSESPVSTSVAFHEESPDVPFLDPVEQDLPQEPLIEQALAPEPASEVEVFQFVDSDPAQGPMSYSVIVGKIDTKELRNQILEAINDPKFGWDPREVMKSVQAGVLHFNDLNPVKASVLVQKLRDLPIEISWTQNVYK
jgi:hypothetical protein